VDYDIKKEVQYGNIDGERYPVYVLIELESQGFRVQVVLFTGIRVVTVKWGFDHGGSVEERPWPFPPSLRVENLAYEQVLAHTAEQLAIEEWTKLLGVMK
jgi:hypothetical protein